MRWRAVVLTGLMWAGLTGPASAATLTGTTSQGRAASISVDAGGVVRAVSVRWRGRCRDVTAKLTTRTRFLDPFLQATPDGVRDRGTYRSSDPDGERLRFRVAMSATRRSAFRWTGTFRATAVVREKGRVIDRCRSGRITWSASIPQIEVDMTSDAGDSIGGGAVFALRSPVDPLTFSATRRQAQGTAAGFTIEIEAPSGQQLTTGTTFPTVRYPFNDGGGGLNVSGNGRGCNESTGTVTVDEASYDARGAATTMTVRFEQHCEGGDAALRGIVRFTR